MKHCIKLEYQSQDSSIAGKHPNYPAIAEHCNLWRNFDDISDSWEVIGSYINWDHSDKTKIYSNISPCWGSWTSMGRTQTTLPLLPDQDVGTIRTCWSLATLDSASSRCCKSEIFFFILFISAHSTPSRPVQSKAQMGMWCMLAAPLIMSNDLRTLRFNF